MMLRFVKYVAGGIALGAATIGVLIVLDYYFPPRYEASAKFLGSTFEIIVEIVPTHPYLAEYERTLILRKAGSSDQRFSMFPDTGGYLRTQLYRLPDGRLLVSDFFDTFVINVVKQKIDADTGVLPEKGVYLGAFDNREGAIRTTWRFIDAGKSPEQVLVMPGG
jgi:hypothetical protein